MIAKITPHSICGQVSAIGSKSFAHRALICAGLFATEPTQIVGITPSNDISATVNCLRALGAQIQEGDVYEINPITKTPDCAVFDCIESGSTLRFFMPIVCALGVKSKFLGSPRLLQRPNQPLFDALASKGVKIDDFNFDGKLVEGEYHIQANVSSQYITGLMFALALLDGNSKLCLDGEVVSKQYIQITIETLASFGVKIESVEGGYIVYGKAHRMPCKTTKYVVEGDWSNSAFFLIGGAINGDVVMSGLNLKSCQGDMRIVDVLKSANANISLANDCVHVEKSKLKAFDVDAQQIPDMVPALCVLASFCDGTTTISGVERLREKESDRLAGVLDTLSLAGVKAEYKDGVLSVQGGVPMGANYLAFNDHRMAMSQSVLALCSKGNSTIDGVECVRKSYPNFFEDLQSLGGGNCVLL